MTFTRTFARTNPINFPSKGVTDPTLHLDGNVEMQTPFDDFTTAAHRDHPRTATQEKHYQILDRAMQEAGFFGYENEWWDYRDTQMDDYEPAAADPNDF